MSGPGDNRRPRLAIVLGLTAVLLLCAGRGHAATVLLTNGDVVRGRIISQTAIEVVVEELLPGGAVKLRTIPSDQVEDVLRPVSVQRLESLSPDDPGEYRLYAEELAEKRVDPEAQATAIRLYLIAAHLAPGEIGLSCLLGMAGLARSESEQKRFRAMAYLLDGAHDRRLLTPDSAAVRAAAGDEQDLQVLEIVRQLRRGKRVEAKRMLDREGAAPRRQRLESLLSPEELQALLSPTCRHCSSGLVDCPQCKGTGKQPTGSPCPFCRTSGSSRGRIRCPVCGGDYRRPELTREQLHRLLTAELVLIGQRPDRAAADTPRPLWTAKDAEEAPVGALSLDAITEFDPRESVFRVGRWTSP